MKQKWITPVILAALVLLGVVGYFLKAASDRVTATQPLGSTGPALSSAPLPGAPSSVAMCVGSASSSASHISLNERYQAAHMLVVQRRFQAALPQLREIAAADPGFPGIDLDISNSLLQLKHPEEAKTAIDTQIAISDCLSRLPADRLDYYCKSELPNNSAAGCRPQLAYVRQAAQLQAALVHLELGHSIGSDTLAATEPAPNSPDNSEATLAPPAPAHVRELAPGPKRIATATHPAPPKTSVNRTLIDGEGTDSSLGAYSKPQE